MSRTVAKISICVSVILSLTALDAAAWGPRAHKAISATAIQVIRRTYSNAFKTYDANYEEDVIRGALAGTAMLNKGKPFTREADAIAAIDNEIRLLRDVRDFGFGSYFSYHMGLLGALVSDLMLPYALMDTPESAAFKEKMQADIDAHLDKYAFRPQQKRREFIYSAQEYLSTRRVYLADNTRMIADDYRRGSGYNGFLKEGGEAWFTRATEAVADAWHSVLLIRSDYPEVAPSKKVVAIYLVDEIRYLLNERKNFYQATKIYENFETVGEGLADAYERIGDLFYAFGTQEAMERGVREWRLTYDMSGADRRRVGKKLGDHYVTVGEGHLKKAARPGASDDDLPNALNAFTEALEFDQTNNTAAARINETNTAIAERKERRQLNVNIIASAEKVKVQAEKKRLEKDFTAAIDTYKQAIGLYEAVDDEFQDQANAAKESVKEINKNITDVINEILDAGSDAIDRGDKAVDEKNFAAGMDEYKKVEAIVSVIPGDETTTHGKNKREMIELSKKKIEDAKLAEQRWEEVKRQQEAAAKAAAGKK